MLQVFIVGFDIKTYNNKPELSGFIFGGKVKHELRWYQKEAFRAVLVALKESKTPYIDLFCGLGKSLIMAAFTDKGLNQGLRVLQLVPTQELCEQNFHEAINYIDDKHKLGIVCASLNKHQGHKQAVVAMVNSFVNKRFKYGVFDILIIDECDLVSPDEKSMYQKIIKTLREFNPNLKIIGLTGSPYRMGIGALENDSIKGKATFTDCVWSSTPHLSRLIKEGYLSEIVSISGDIQADLSKVRVNSSGEYDSELMAVKFDEIIDHAVPDFILKLSHYDIKTALIFASNLANARHIITRYKQETGLDNIRLVSGEMDKTERRRTLEWLKHAPGQRLIVNVGVLTRGYNYTGLDCVIFLRATQSLSLYVQCLDYQTEILTKEGWKSHGNINKNDIVAGFNLDTELTEWQKTINVYDREVYFDEKFITIKSKFNDIRVTDNHNFVVKPRNGKKWILEKAIDSHNRKSTFIIPISSDINNGDNYLTDSQLSFIGWFLTDGTINKKNKQLSISQRIGVKENDHIISALKGCNFRYGVNITKRKGFVFGVDASNYDDIIRYCVSYGNPRKRNDTGIYGWNILEKWLDKSVPSCFNSLSKRQLLVMLNAMNKANGAKRITTWNQKTMDICMGHNKVFVDRFQELCVMRGLRCNIKEYNSLILSICDKSESYIKGKGEVSNEYKQQTFIDKPSVNERVWCIETPLKTIFTRRNGKVSILGNCVGRVIRSHDDKECGYVIDYGTNIARLGAIDDIKPPEPKKRKSEQPKKACTAIIDNPKGVVKEIKEVTHRRKFREYCGYQNTLSAKKCELCGAIFITDETTEGNYSMRTHAEILKMKREEKQIKHDVKYVFFQAKISKAGHVMADMNIVNKDNITIHHHFLCLDHPGFAKQQAHRFIKQWMRDPSHFDELVQEGLTTESFIDLVSDDDIILKYFKNIKSILLEPRKDNAKYNDVIAWTFES